MLENYRKRMSLYGDNINEAMMNISNDIKDMVFDGTTTYKRVRIGKRYYDARVMRDIDASVNNPSPNFVIQFRGDKTVPIGTYIYIPFCNAPIVCAGCTNINSLSIRLPCVPRTVTQMVSDRQKILTCWITSLLSGFPLMKIVLRLPII